MRFRSTVVVVGIAALAFSTISISPAGAAPPIAGTTISRPIPPAQQQTQSRTQTAQRGSVIIVDASGLNKRYNAIHPITDSTCQHSVPIATPAGGIGSDTNYDGIVDDIYWEFSDGTWERVGDYDFDADADALAIDVSADGFAEIQIWDNENCTFSVYQDSDGDAVFETEELLTRSQLDDELPGITDFLDINFGPAGS